MCNDMILGTAQVVVALVLAFFTWKLWQSTSEYASDVKIQANTMQKQMKFDCFVIQLNRRYDEMHKLVGPLYNNRLDDDLFMLPSFDLFRKGSVKERYLIFWSDIRRNAEYTQDNDLREKLHDFFDLINDFQSGGTKADSAISDHKGIKNNLIKTTERRYKNLVAEIDKSEEDFRTVVR